jgi:predicted neuraminidase
VLALFGGLSIAFSPPPKAPGFSIPSARQSDGSPTTPRLETRFVSHNKTEVVHCATVVELSSNRLRAFWYGGSYEGATDVAIYTSLFDPQLLMWGPEIPLITPNRTQKGLHRYVRKIGNPTAMKTQTGDLWLFYVSVSVGGWAGSSINLTISRDQGRHWSAPRRLITSPFLNLSTLVKAPPFLFADGTVGVPVYHEFIGKFGELLRLDKSGNIMGKTRLSRGRSAIQPLIVPLSQDRATGLLRHCGDPPGRVLFFQTTDRGHHWSRPVKTNALNPNSGIAALPLDNGDLLMVHNNSEDELSDLSLSHSRDRGKTWRVIHAFEKEETEPNGRTHRFYYPCFIRSENGDFHLLYTWYRTHIKHVRFNRAWLEQRL